MRRLATATDDCRLAWWREGDRGSPTLLLCNSIGTDYRLWDPQLAGLVQRFDIIRFDMRGHGASEAPEGDYSLAVEGGPFLYHLTVAEQWPSAWPSIFPTVSTVLSSPTPPRSWAAPKPGSRAST